MYALTDEERESFRDDFREREREGNKYIGVYLSGLALVTGWIIGPQSKPMIAIALGNEGHNLRAVLFLVVLNVVFTCFLIYKSLLVHEIMQFSVAYSTGENAFPHWEKWRRSSFSMTHGLIRASYTIMLSIIPIVASGTILYLVGQLLWSEAPEVIAALSGQLDIDALHGYQRILSDPDYLETVLSSTRPWFFAASLLHLIPLGFFVTNVVRANRVWADVLSSDRAVLQGKVDAAGIEISRLAQLRSGVSSMLTRVREWAGRAIRAGPIFALQALKALAGSWASIRGRLRPPARKVGERNKKDGGNRAP